MDLKETFNQCFEEWLRAGTKPGHSFREDIWVFFERAYRLGQAQKPMEWRDISELPNDPSQVVLLLLWRRKTDDYRVNSFRSDIAKDWNSDLDEDSFVALKWAVFPEIPRPNTSIEEEVTSWS